MLPSREEIIKQGFVEIRLRIAGIIQKHHFQIEKEKTVFGDVIYLTTKGKVTPVDLAKLAEELQLPVRSPRGTAFPKGKALSDFAIKIE